MTPSVASASACDQIETRPAPGTCSSPGSQSSTRRRAVKPTSSCFGTGLRTSVHPEIRTTRPVRPWRRPGCRSVSTRWSVPIRRSSTLPATSCSRATSVTLPPQSTVIELLESVDGEAEVTEACRALKEKGYAIALDDFVYRPTLDPLIPLADVIKIGFRDFDPKQQVEHLRQRGCEAVLLAETVETHEEYQRAVDLGFTRFQGFFFCKPEVVSGRVLSPARLTYLKLLQAVTRPELQIDEVDAVIRADVGMTHRLLKYLGSAALGFRTEVTSVRHGLALLGREQTRRFVSLVALGEMGSEKPPELLVASAVRGRFCELIGDDVALADQKAELFLMGLLSLVDAMLDQPMTRVLEQLSLSRDLTNALIGEKSQLRPVLEFVEHYERAEWTAASGLAAAHGIVEAKVCDYYNEAIAWATKALKG